MELKKEYLGDGLYATHDGYGIEVTSEDGVSVLDRVYFEPSVLKALVDYNDRVLKEYHNQLIEADN